MIDEEQYVTTQHQIGTFATLVLSLPLEGFIEVAERASTVGPFLDPTLYRQGGDNLTKITELARALLTFKHEVIKQMGEGQKKSEQTPNHSRH